MQSVRHANVHIIPTRFISATTCARTAHSMCSGPAGRWTNRRCRCSRRAPGSVPGAQVEVILTSDRSCRSRSRSRYDRGDELPVSWMRATSAGETRARCGPDTGAWSCDGSRRTWSSRRPSRARSSPATRPSVRQRRRRSRRRARQLHLGQVHLAVRVSGSIRVSRIEWDSSCVAIVMMRWCWRRAIERSASLSWLDE